MLDFIFQFKWRHVPSGSRGGYLSLDLSPLGAITGVPFTQGCNTFTAEVADSMGETVSMPWSISVVGSFGTIEVNLEAGAMDSGEYGYNFGDSLHEVELIATFESAAQDLVLSVTGYDYHLGFRFAILYMTQNLYTVHLGHPNIGDDDIGLIFIEYFGALDSVTRRCGLNPLLLEDGTN